MKHSRMAFAMVSGISLLVLAGCPGSAVRYVGTDSTCQNPRPNGPGRTSPIVEISVSGRSVVVTPDTFRLFPGDLVVWELSAPSVDSGPGYGWQVRFNAGDTLFERIAGVDTSAVVRASSGKPLGLTSADGRLAGGVISTAAACRSYHYTVKVWPAGGADTTTLDPDGDILPSTY